MSHKNTPICLGCLYGQETTNIQPKQNVNDLKEYKEWLTSPSAISNQNGACGGGQCLSNLVQCGTHQIEAVESI